MKATIACLLTILIASVFSGCSHGTTVSNHIDEKVAAETAVHTRDDLRGEAARLLEATKSLTDEQKNKISATMTLAWARSDELRELSYKLRAVLLKDLISQSYDRGEVEEIKDRIRDADAARLEILLSAVEQINEILGHLAGAHMHLEEQFLMGHSSGPGS